MKQLSELSESLWKNLVNDEIIESRMDFLKGGDGDGDGNEEPPPDPWH